MAKVAYARGPDVGETNAEKDEDYPIVSPGAEEDEKAETMVDKFINGIPVYDTRLFTPLGGIPVPRVDPLHALSEKLCGEYDVEKHLCNINVVNSNVTTTFGVVTSPEFLMTLAANPMDALNPVKCTQKLASFVEDKLSEDYDMAMDDEDEDDEKDMDHEVPCNPHDTVLPGDDEEDD